MGLSDTDTEAVSTAIAILNAAGYRVEKSNQVKPSGEAGVQFKLQVQAPTKTPWFGPQSEAVQEAAAEIPDFDMAGEPVEEVADGD